MRPPLHDGSMPWLALPFADRGRKEDLSQFFEVQGIPTFVMLSPTLKVLQGGGWWCKKPSLA